MKTLCNYFVYLIFILSFFPGTVHARDGFNHQNPVSVSHLNEQTINYYYQLIRDYFESSGITYSSSIKKTDPFLQEDKCVEKYSQYSIKSISYIKSEKSSHIFRVFCSGVDGCNRIVATHGYNVTVNISDNSITYTKMESR